MGQEAPPPTPPGAQLGQEAPPPLSPSSSSRLRPSCSGDGRLLAGVPDNRRLTASRSQGRLMTAADGHTKTRNSAERLMMPVGGDDYLMANDNDDDGDGSFMAAGGIDEQLLSCGQSRRHNGIEMGFGGGREVGRRSDGSQLGPRSFYPSIQINPNFV